MDKRITILTNTKTKDSDGFPRIDWPTYKTVWANVRDLSGRSFYQLNAEQQVKTLTFTIWNNKDINESMRVKYSNNVYRIIRIYQGDHISNNQFMCLDCQIIKGVSD